MLELVEQNIVVIGSINSAIIQPNWLSKIKLSPKGEPIQVKMNIGANSSEYQWKEKFKWVVDSNSVRVSIRPELSRNELTRFVTTIFSALSHTPVTATGHNFFFQGKPEEVNVKFSRKDDWGIKEKKNLGTITRLQHQITFEESEMRKVSIYLTQNHEKSTVQVNFHYDVPSTEKVVEYSNEVEKNFMTANKLLKEVIST